MPSTVRRLGGGTLVAAGLVVLLAALGSLRRLTPLPENADVPSGFALVFLLLLCLVGLGLLAGGTALLGTDAAWVGDRTRLTFRAAGYLVAGGLPLGLLAVPLTGRIEFGGLVVVAAVLLGTVLVGLGVAVAAASAVRRAVAG